MRRMKQQQKKTQFGRWTRGNYWKERVKCYFLLVFGTLFMFIGTYVSIADIIKIYTGAT